MFTVIFLLLVAMGHRKKINTKLCIRFHSDSSLCSQPLFRATEKKKKKSFLLLFSHLFYDTDSTAEKKKINANISTSIAVNSSAH